MTDGSQGMTVLLAGDDEALLEFSLTIQRQDVYEVLVAVNGREALDLANSQLDRKSISCSFMFECPTWAGSN